MSEPRDQAATPPRHSIDPAWTVAQIIGDHPWAAPVLRRFGLDVCCGGSHPLGFACRAHRIDVATVLEALRAAAPGGIPSITAESCVREVIAAHPRTVEVFDRFGLMGCGGAGGPNEPIGWFARVHHVDVERLLRELRAAAAGGSTAAPAARDAAPAAAETLYKRFLKAALLFTFTGGTALGAWALVLMGMRGQLGGIGRGIIQVHGHWQLFGWVGLFVAGVAYHILPRLTGVPLASYRAASLSFVLLVTGTVLRAAQALDPSAARGVLLLGGALLEVGGCAIFAWIVARTLGRQATGQPYQTWLAVGSGWLVVAALLNLAHARHLAESAVFEVPPHLNIPYLTVFLVGFVAFWILGVSLRTLPVFMGLHARPRLAGALPLPLSAAIAAMTVGEAEYLAGGADWARILFGVGGAGVALLLALGTFALGILSPRREEREPGVDHGYEKFLRLGYAWLAISAGMLLVFSGLAIAGRDLDHALVGAYRHALTVGFITTVMLGMASRIIPVFRGVPLHSMRLREWTFWLLAIGNAIRVVFQALSAFAGPAFLRVAGVSGILELGALLLFGYNLWRTLEAPEPSGTGAARPLPPIAPETIVGELVAACPDLLPVFVRSGFTALANPLLRRTLARGVSIRQACRLHGVDLQRFLGDLAAERTRGGA